MYIAKHPVKCVIVASSGCGKSTYAQKLINSNLIANMPKKIIWFHKMSKPPIKSTKKIIFKNTFPENENGFPKNSVCLLDDYLIEILRSRWMINVWLRLSRHRKITVILLSQSSETTIQNNMLNEFFKNSDLIIVPTIIKNKKFVMKQIKEVQSDKNKAKEILNEYEHLSEINGPFFDIAFDYSTSCKNAFRIRSNNIPKENEAIYVYNNSNSVHCPTVFKKPSNCAYLPTNYEKTNIK